MGRSPTGMSLAAAGKLPASGTEATAAHSSQHEWSGGSAVGWALSRDDVAGVVELLTSLSGCWEDAAAEVTKKPEQAEGVTWACLRDAAECMCACVKLLGS